MIAVDTLVVVRYLTGAPPDQARRARVLLDGADRLGIPIVVLLEAGHVLRSRYGVRRSAVVDTLLDFVTLEKVETIGLPKHVVVEALVRARQLPDTPVADALIVAMAREAGSASLASFDGGVRRLGIAVIEP